MAGWLQSGDQRRAAGETERAAIVSVLRRARGRLGVVLSSNDAGARASVL
jgi:hypothetical protein